MTKLPVSLLLIQTSNASDLLLFSIMSEPCKLGKTAGCLILVQWKGNILLIFIFIFIINLFQTIQIWNPQLGRKSSKNVKYPRETMSTPF